MTSFLKIAQQFFVCEYFLLIPIDLPSFKLIEGQIKELQGVVPNTPQAENDQKSQGRIGLNTTFQLYHDLQSFASEFHEITNISIPRNLTAPTLSPG